MKFHEITTCSKLQVPKIKNGLIFVLKGIAVLQKKFYFKN